MMTLRPYQREAVNAIRESYNGGRGITRQLLALPTGTGKTVVFAEVSQDIAPDQRAVVFVHREELADQAAQTIRDWNPNLSVGIEMAGRYSDPSDRVVVASIPTLGRNGSERIKRFNPLDFNPFICDEAHHYIADSYRRVLDYFGLLAQDNRKLLLGVTATPNRGDGQKLGTIFDKVVYQMSILEAIQSGWLSDIRGIRIRTDVSLDGVSTRAGDFAVGELEDAVNTPKRNHLIVQEWMKHAGTRKTVVFTVDIKHAHDLAQTFQLYGVAAEAVWGDDAQRAEKLAFHKAGKIQVLTNCGVLIEGYDDWAISCIVMARPTKSQLLFVQMAGRGTRLQKGIDNLLKAKQDGIPLVKEDCLLIDVTDNTQRHSLVTLASIFGLSGKLDLKGKSVTGAIAKFADVQSRHPSVDLTQLEDYDQLEAFAERVDLFKVKFEQAVVDNSNLQWHKTPDGGFVLLLPNKERVFMYKDLLDKWTVDGSVKGSTFKVDGFTDEKEAFNFGDSMVERHGRDLLTLLRRESRWHKDPATPTQLNALRRFRISPPENLSKGEASLLLNKLFSEKRVRT